MEIVKHENAALDMQKYRAAIMSVDFARLSEDERFNWLIHTCQKIGIDPITKPIEFITLNGKLKPYFTRMATDEIRKNEGINIDLAERKIDSEMGIISIIVKASTPDGRVDFATGIVALPKGAENIANAIMKAETKAKRRATLSICGLGFTDESELDTMQSVITEPKSKQQPRTPALPPMQMTERKPITLSEPKSLTELRTRYEGALKVIKKTYPNAKAMLSIALNKAVMGVDESYRAVLRFFTGEENMNAIDVKEASILLKWLQYEDIPDWQPAESTYKEVEEIITEMIPVMIPAGNAYENEIEEAEYTEDDSFDYVIKAKPEPVASTKRKFNFNETEEANG